MKFTAQEEYGLRCLLQIARHDAGESLTIPEIARVEGLSIPNVAKLLRILRRGEFVKSVRGQAGGYILARPPDDIIVGEVLAVLGGRLFAQNFCELHAGLMQLCTHSVDCSIRSLWSTVQGVVDDLLSKTTLKHLLCGELETRSWMNNLAEDPLRILN